MKECEWCGKENDGKITCVIATVGRFEVCGDCLNKYHAGEYDKIKVKIPNDKRWGIKKWKKHY